MTESADAAPARGEPAASRWEDFIDIFYAPSQVFARRATSGFFLPMLVVTLLGGLFFLIGSNAWSTVMDAEFTRGMARRAGTLSAEQMEKARGFAQVSSKVVAFVATPIGIFLTGAMLWACGKLFDAKERAAQAIMVAAYAFVPRVLEGLVAAVQGLLFDPNTFDGRWRLSIGPARFLDPDATSPALLGLVGRFDFFTIWVTVLLAIGLSVVGKIPRARAALAAAMVWLLGALPLLLQVGQ